MLDDARVQRVEVQQHHKLVLEAFDGLQYQFSCVARLLVELARFVSGLEHV